MQAGVVVAELLLSRGQVEEARALLTALLRDPRLRANSLRFHVVEAEARLFASKLRARPGEWVARAVRGEARVEVAQAGPIDLALDAWKLATTAAKWAQADLRSPAAQDPSLLWLLPRIADLQLRCVSQLALLFRVIGAPRELKCHLKWGVRLAQTSCLPLRAADLLLHLASSHLLCDDDAAAEVVLAGVDFTLDLVAKGRKEEREEGREVVSLPGQVEVQEVTASPSLCRTAAPRPEFLKHAGAPSPCTCAPCSSPPLHSIVLRLAMLRSATAHMAGQVDTAAASFLAAVDMAPGLLERTVRVEEVERWRGHASTRLQEELVEGLQGRLECLASKREWAGCREVLGRQKEHLARLPTTRLRAVPHLLLREMDQEAYLEEAMREVEVVELVEDLGERLGALEVGASPCGGSTPEVTGRGGARARGGAPSKRALPSLGIGDPAGIAKDLEKLGLVGEASPSPLPPREKAPPPPRQRSSVLDMLNDNVKRVVPKVTLTEDTPKRFFRSRGGEAAPTPTVKAAGRTSKTDSKKKAESTPTTTTKENQAYRIYEDMDPSPTAQVTRMLPHTRSFQLC